MALDDDSPMEAAVAHIFIAASNTVAPTAVNINAMTLPTPTLAGWVNFGHTSLENDFAPFREGGDSTVRGSRQNPRLRESIAATTEGMNVNPIQVLSETLQYYYGGGTTPSAGVFEIPVTRTPLEKAVVIAYFDGTNVEAEYHAKASIIGTGALVNGAEGFMQFPLRMTWLQGTETDKWIGENLTVLA
jgi:hypothetical protein